MSDLVSEQEAKDYWDNIRNKTDSIVEVLKGSNHQECQQIIKFVNERVERQLGALILFK